MKKIKIELPKEYQTVLITYTVGDRIVTRKAFYSKSDGYYNSVGSWVTTPEGYFSVPKHWRVHSFSDGESALLPHTFESYGNVLPEMVTKVQILDGEVIEGRN